MVADMLEKKEGKTSKKVARQDGGGVWGPLGAELEGIEFAGEM